MAGHRPGICRASVPVTIDDAGRLLPRSRAARESSHHGPSEHWPLKGISLRILIWPALLVPLLLSGCVEPQRVTPVVAKNLYLAAKNECVARYRDNLTGQSDCRTRAADYYIRPTYRYPDLMTRAQEQRHALAVRADQHEISRRTYDREIARSEAAISREEDRRNAAAISHGGPPSAPTADAIGGLIQ